MGRRRVRRLCKRRNSTFAKRAEGVTNNLAGA
jgi:hypothetical protein